jgi:dynein heavy chain
MARLASGAQELYGYVNMATREWKDGLLSYNMRELANMPDDAPKWILLDGDLDANWIESMNSASSRLAWFVVWKL